MPRKTIKPATRGIKRKNLIPTPQATNSSNATQTTITGKALTSFASRKRKRAYLRMGDILNLSSAQETKITDHSTSFNSDSLVHDTWGPTQERAEGSTEQKRRCVGFRRKFGGLGAGIAFSKFMMGGVVNGEEKEPNSPERSIFLRLPLEIRQMVYGLMLETWKPIRVESDWVTTNLDHGFPHQLMSLCVQITTEARAFGFSRRPFYAEVGFRRISLSPKIINPRFLPLIQNVVLNVPQDKWNMHYAKETAVSIKKLKEVGANLVSITLQVSPKTIISSKLQKYAPTDFLTFAKWLSPNPARGTLSLLLNAIYQSRCLVFNLIIKLPDNKRILVSIQTRRGMREGDIWLVNDEAARLARKMENRKLKGELKGLKNRFELVFRYPEQAILNGEARLLEKWEQATDGLKLLKRADDPRKLMIGAKLVPQAESIIIAPATGRDCMPRWQCSQRLRSDEDFGLPLPL